MIFNTVLVALLSATLSSAAAIRSAAIGPAPASTSGIFPLYPLIETCVNENLDTCVTWSGATLGASCSRLDEIFNSGIDLKNKISSVATLDSRVVCTLFTSTTCTGRSLFVNGTINALSAFNFDNVATSLTCDQVVF
ncbi:hypothetical protein C8R46DRAFT_1214954 [Mycena filopes]|nr:hypothetical protein C8R46DRAFT_1214954 [Mycena filopes]